MSDLPFGIDISKHQGSNDYAKMKANTSFVFVKATESWGYTDPKFYANWVGLVGHNRGAYSYVWLSDDPLRQANHLIDIVTQAGVGWKYDRLVLDLEKSGHGLSKAEVSRRVLVMMERIKEVTGRYPILYSRKYWVQDNMVLTDPRFINADWWLAYYRTALPYPLYTPEMPPPPLLPTGVSKWLFHQTCEKGKGREVGVGSYYVDQNRFNGTREQLDAYFGLDEEGSHEIYLPIIIKPEPEPETPLYQAIVTTVFPNRLRVRRTPNGEFVRWLISGETVNVYQETNGWYRIGVGEWASAEYLQRVFDRPDLLNVPLYSQRDPRWANDKMGRSNITLGQQGCLVTVTTAGLTYLGYPIDPKVYNHQASTRGGYQPPNLMYWKFPDVLTNGKIIRDEYSIWYSTGKGWETLADNILASGRPVWAHVDFDRDTGAIEQHWVLIIGKDEYGYWVYDPWIGAIASLSARYDGKVFRIASYRRVG